MRKCVTCGLSFSPFVHNQERCRNCSDEYAKSKHKHKRLRERKLTKYCEWCNKEFPMTGPASRYCSKECHQQKTHASVYNLTREEYLILSSRCTCDICGKEGFFINPNYKLKFVIDHDHKTGKVRGWLCHNCNRALGLFNDDIEVMEKAITYLKGATTIP